MEGERRYNSPGVSRDVISRPSGVSSLASYPLIREPDEPGEMSVSGVLVATTQDSVRPGRG